MIKHSVWQSDMFSYTNKLQIKLRWALFVTYTIIQSIMRSEMCSLHLTHPSGAAGSRHCGAWGAVGGSVPCSRVSPQSWTIPARAGIRTHNLGLPRVSSKTLYPLGHDCPRAHYGVKPHKIKRNTQIDKEKVVWYIFIISPRHGYFVKENIFIFHSGQ